MMFALVFFAVDLEGDKGIVVVRGCGVFVRHNACISTNAISTEGDPQASLLY